MLIVEFVRAIAHRGTTLDQIRDRFRTFHLETYLPFVLSGIQVGMGQMQMGKCNYIALLHVTFRVGKRRLNHIDGR